ncbi:MAG: hypothetical protein KAG53_10720 [Endozoicomonadaceae bacterium]|nr:hypothetical protein [Endozoicomonadaceae bacterium]
MQSVQFECTQSVLQAVTDHACSTQKSKKSKNRVTDRTKINESIKGFVLSKLNVNDDGAIECVICKKNIKSGDRKIVKSNTKECIEIIQHICYAMGCSLNALLSDNGLWSSYAQLVPELNQTRVQIWCPSANLVLSRHYE